MNLRRPTPLPHKEIGLIRPKLESVNQENQFSRFVIDAELAFSREHTLWIARRSWWQGPNGQSAGKIWSYGRSWKPTSPRVFEGAPGRQPPGKETNASAVWKRPSDVTLVAVEDRRSPWPWPPHSSRAAVFWIHAARKLDDVLKSLLTRLEHRLVIKTSNSA
jgi:hypothetical protein